jgi:hypothetical protein
MHRPFRSLSLAITLVVGAGLLVLPDPALADPPDWAKANGHRAQHTADGKRHGRDGDHGDYDVTPQSLFGGACVSRDRAALRRGQCWVRAWHRR